MLRDLLKEGGLYTISSFLTKGISLFLLPFYAAYFSPTDYGIIDILAVFGTLLNSVVSLQFNQGLGRFVTEPKYNESIKNLIGSTVIWSTSVLYIIAVLLIIAFPQGFISILSTEEVSIPERTFILSVLAISINGIFYILNVYIRFLRKATAFASLSFFHALFNILLTIYLVLIEDLGIDGIFIASIVVTPAIVIVQAIILRKQIRFEFDLRLFKKIFWYSIPLVPAALAYIILNFTDRIFIKEYLSFNEEGIYAMGSKFSLITSIIIMGFSSALAPLVYEKHRDENTKRELGRIFRLFYAVGTGGVLLLSLFSYETLVVFTNSNYYDAQYVMPFLYTAIFITGFGMFSPGLHLKGKTGLIALVVLISAVINVILNYFLITEFKLAGAAIATLISICINNITLFIFSQKYYPFQVKMRPIMISTIVFAGILVFYFNFLPEMDIGFWWQVFVKVVLVILYGLLVVQLKMINFSRLIKRIK